MSKIMMRMNRVNQKIQVWIWNIKDYRNRLPDLLQKKFVDSYKNKIIFLFVALLFLVPRVKDLKYDISNSDAARWHRRSINFGRALKEGNFKETYQRYHPGVTIMMIGSSTEFFLEKYQSLRGETPKTLENADWYPVIHRYSRIVLLAFLTILLLMQFKFILVLFNKQTAILYVTLVSLEPYLIGINRWFHLTSLEVNLMFTSLLSLIMWKSYKDSKLLLLSSFLLSFGLLTKISAILIVPSLLVTLILAVRNTKSKAIIASYILLTCLFCYVLFPAVWTNFFYVIKNVLGGITGSVEGEIRPSPYIGLLNTIYYPVILMYKLSPVLFIAIILSIWSLRKSKAFNVLILFFTVAVFLFGMTIVSQKIDRYSIAFFYPLILLVSIYFSESTIKRILLSILIFFTYISAVNNYHPNYSLYYSLLFGGPQKALEAGFYDNSGEYFTDAALYLNEKGRDIYTYIPHNIESFSYFYKGNVIREYDDSVDYIVYSLDTNRRNIRYYPNCEKIEKTFGPRNFSAVFVIKCQRD